MTPDTLMTLDHQTLKHAVRIAKMATASRSTQWMHEHIALRGGPDGLTVEATDGRVSVSYRLPGVYTPFHLCLTAKLLKDLIDRLPPGDIRLEPDTSALTLGWGTVSTATIKGRDGDAWWMTLPSPDHGTSIATLSVAAIDIIAREVCYAASEHDSLPTLEGVRLTCSEQVLTAACLDRYQLGVVGIDLVTMVQPWQGTVDAAAWRTAAAMVAGSGAATVTVFVTDSHVILESPTMTVSLIQIDGTFPDYERFFPHESACTLSVERVALLAALDRLCVFGGSRIELTVHEGTDPGIILRDVDSQEQGTTIEQVMWRQITRRDADDPLGTVYVNKSLLRETIRKLTSAIIHIEISGGMTPIVIHTVRDESNESDGCSHPSRHIVMPMGAPGTGGDA